MNNITERNKKRILKVSASIIEKGGVNSLTIPGLADLLRQPKELLEDLFEDDDNLRIQTIKYAATVWCDFVLKQAKSISDKKERLRFVIEQFVFGSDVYFGSFSSYIDIWFQIRHSSICTRLHNFLCTSLLEINDIFKQTFLSIISEIHMSSRNEVLAFLIISISDGIYIQRLLGNKDIDKQRICDELYKFSYECIELLIEV